jgi:hypothetical protein
MKIFWPKIGSAVALGHGLGAHGGQVGTGLGLGEVHGAGPLARHHLVQVGLLLLVGAAQQQRFDGALVSSGHSEKAMLADFHISITAVATSLGRPWPPNSGSQRQRVPARLDELRVG